MLVFEYPCSAREECVSTLDVVHLFLAAGEACHFSTLKPVLSTLKAHYSLVPL